MEREYVKNRLIHIIREIRGSMQIVEESRVFHDLGISGDDALDLFDKLHNEFGTDFSGLQFEEFFPNETDAGFYFYLPFLFKKTKRSQSQSKI